MDRQVVMWAKSNCSFCGEAMKELIQHGMNHTVHIMDDKVADLAEVKERWNHSTVPVVVLKEDDNETLIGGFTELKKWLVDDNK